MPLPMSTSAKVLMRELQSLGLDIGVHKIEIFDNISKGIEIDLMSNNKDYDINQRYSQSIINEEAQNTLMQQDTYFNLDLMNN